jgi:hypothetical protein
MLACRTPSYKRISVALIPLATAVVYIDLGGPDEERPSMKSGGNVWGLYWRRFSVDVLIGTATLAVAFTATGATADVLYMLLIPGALVGIGLVLEPNVAAQPAGSIGQQPPRLLTESKPARPEPQAMGRFDAAIVDAASV